MDKSSCLMCQLLPDSRTQFHRGRPISPSFMIDEKEGHLTTGSVALVLSSIFHLIDPLSSCHTAPSSLDFTHAVFHRC